MRLQETYIDFIRQLQQLYSEGEAAAIAALIWEEQLRITRAGILSNPDRILTAGELSIINKSIQQLLRHQPAQYITGKAWFYNRLYKVNEHVLIPRPETEELVHWIINDHQNRKPSFSILDIGTGSGCIPVTLALHLNSSHVFSTDVSTTALAVAKENAAANNATVTFVEGDFLNPDSWKHLPVANIIVSNPPYIPVNEKEKLDKNVTQWEPHTALFVPDNSPLLFYENILLFAKTHLSHNGCIYLEVHEDYAQQTAALFTEKYKEVVIKKDMSGKERMIKITHCH